MVGDDPFNAETEAPTKLDKFTSSFNNPLPATAADLSQPIWDPNMELQQQLSTLIFESDAQCH